jgi:hypothetical protein
MRFAFFTREGGIDSASRLVKVKQPGGPFRRANAKRGNSPDIVVSC